MQNNISKRYITLFIMSLCLFIPSLAAVETTVSVATAGSLKTTLQSQSDFNTDSKCQTITKLAVTGSINGEDLTYVTSLAGHASGTGALETLDLSGVSSITDAINSNGQLQKGYFNEVVASGTTTTTAATNLKSLTLPTCIKDIAWGALTGMTNMSSVNLADGNTTLCIKDNALCHLNGTVLEIIYYPVVCTKTSLVISYYGAIKVSLLSRTQNLKTIILSTPTNNIEFGTWSMWSNAALEEMHLNCNNITYTSATDVANTFSNNNKNVQLYYQEHDNVLSTNAMVKQIDSTPTPEVILMEGTDYSVPKTTSSIKTLLYRSLQQNTWNTICLPFAVSNVESVFGTGTKIAKLSSLSSDNEKAIFTVESTMEANTPYLINPTNSSENIWNFSSADLNTYSAAGVNSVSDDLKMIGNYTAGLSVPTSANSYVLQNGVLRAVESNNVTLDAYHAYFTINISNPSKSFSLNFNNTTGVETVNNNTMNDKIVYNIQGQCISTKGIDGLPAGLYITNGKKITIK